MVLADFTSGLKIVQVVEVSQELLDHWGRYGSKQLIAYLELWPVLVCLHHYGLQFSGRRAIFCIDNNAVRDALIKGSSPNIDMFVTLALCSLQASKCGLHAGYTRTASASNPADAPSRDQAADMASRLGARLEQPLSVPPELEGAVLTRRSFERRRMIHPHWAQLIEKWGGGSAGCSGLNRAGAQSICDNVAQYHLRPLPHCQRQALVK